MNNIQKQDMLFSRLDMETMYMPLILTWPDLTKKRKPYKTLVDLLYLRDYKELWAALSGVEEYNVIRLGKVIFANDLVMPGGKISGKAQKWIEHTLKRQQEEKKAMSGITGVKGAKRAGFERGEIPAELLDYLE